MNSPVSKSRRYQAVRASNAPADQRRRRYLNDWVGYLALVAHLFTLRVAGAARSRCVVLSGLRGRIRVLGYRIGEECE